MKIKTALGSLFASALLIWGCTTDFDLEAEWKDIPIVYAFISIQDTAHYVRVQKAFLEPGGNALEIAQIPDSIYYQNINVELVNLQTGQSYALDRVDGNLEGYPKEEGVFANSPNVLYKVRANLLNLKGGERLRLVLNRGDELPPVTAETTVVAEIDSVTSVPSRNINRWLYTELKQLAWRPGLEARIFDARLVIHYRESQPSSPSVFERKSLEWVINPAVFNESNEPRVTITASGDAFYRFIGNNISKSTGEIRLFEELELVVTGAGEELYQFVRLRQANTGITSAQNLPVYTNMSEGLGIFSSRYTMRRTGIRLQQEARDSLVNGIYTKDLNFR
jgi:hypothetical protein